VAHPPAGLRTYALIDVHYYLQSWTPPAGTMILYSGIEFPLVSGRYPLPFNNGELTVYDDEIVMHTAGQSESYRHKNVYIKSGFDSSFNPGWLNFGFGKCTARDWQLCEIKTVCSRKHILSCSGPYH